MDNLVYEVYFVLAWLSRHALQESVMTYKTSCLNSNGSENFQTKKEILTKNISFRGLLSAVCGQ